MVDEKEFALPLGSILFPRIFCAFRMAIQPSKLAIAFAALAAICLTGWTMDLSRTVVTGNYTVALPRGASNETRGNQTVTELDVYMRSSADLKNFIISREATGDRAGVFSTLWHCGADEFHNAVYAVLSLDIPGIVRTVANGIRALAWAFRWHTLYSIIFFAIAFVILSLAGGAICRIAATQFARADRPRLMQAIRFSQRRLASLVGAPLGPVLIILAFGVPTVLLGLIGNLPVAGPLLTGLLLPLSLAAACATTIVLIGAIGGLSLMSPAIAYDDSDSFDAISRSFIVYSDPWRMGFYTIVAVVYGAICYLFVRLFGFLLLWMTRSFLQIGFLEQNQKLDAIWPAPTFDSLVGPVGAMPGTWPLWLAALLIRVWVLAVVGLIASFAISFYFSASTIVYALMRKRVDGTPPEEIHTSQSEASAEPQLSGTESQAGDSEPAMETNRGSGQTPKTSE